MPTKNTRSKLSKSTARTMLIPNDLYAWVVAKAEEEDRTISSFVRWVLTRYRKQVEWQAKQPNNTSHPLGTQDDPTELPEDIPGGGC